MILLRERFRGRIFCGIATSIGAHDHQIWRQPLHFYLGSHFKSRMFEKSPRTIHDLKEYIRRWLVAINAIPVEALGKRAHTEKSFRNLIKSNRNQIELIIFWLIWIQTEVRLDPNQSENGKYNLISGWFNKISRKKILCVQKRGCLSAWLQFVVFWHLWMNRWIGH